VGSIPLKVLPASEVFDLERKERQERERRSIDHFVSEISEKVFQVDVEQDIEGGVRSLDFAVEVRDRALTYLENASNR
jgi:hypothetical protein